MVGVAGTVVIVRLVGAAGARWAGAAMGARPVTGRRAGAEPTHPLRRSISRMDQGIGLERDDVFESSSRSGPTRSTGGQWILLTPGDQQRCGCRRTASSSLQATAIRWTA